MRVLMTGATGAVGRALSDELTERGHDVRPVGRRCEIAWDMSDPRPPRVDEAIDAADVVVHAAADIRLGATWEQLAPINVTAPAELAKWLANHPCPPRLLIVSSAFAPPRGGAHHNHYERSKWEAEVAVRTQMPDVTVLRPSLVIGRRADGWIPRFSGIYQFLRMLAHGLVPAVPGKGDVRLDVVPVDVVAATFADEIETPSGRGVIEAVSGAASPTLEVLIGSLFDELPEDRTRPKFVEPEVYHRLFRPLVEPELSAPQLALLDMIEIFLPYFETDHTFGEERPMVDEDEVVEAWRRSIRHWAEVEGLKPDRGAAVWAKR